MRWKWILAAVAGIIVVLIVVTVIVVKSYDFNNLKPQITQFVKDATGRELILGGELVLDIDFTPSISVKDVTFGNTPWGTRPALAKIKQLSVEVAVLPLLRGNIEVRQLIIIEPDILVETDPSGKSNLEFKPAGTEKDDTMIPLFAFNEIRIQQGKLKYKDGKTNQAFALDLDLFKASASNFYSKIRFQLNGQYNEKEVGLKGEIESTAALLSPGITCSVNLTAKLGSANLAVDGAIKDALHMKGFNGTVTADGPSISELLEAAGMVGPSDLGPFNVTAKLLDTDGTITVESIRFKAGTDALAQITLSGAIENVTGLQGAKLDFEINGKDIAKLETLSQKKMPVRGPFSASGKLSGASANRFEIGNLIVRLGDNTVEGSVGLNLLDPKPELTMTLSSPHLDLKPHWVSVVPDIIEKGDLFDIGPFQLAMKLVGPVEQPMLENMELRFGSQKRIETRLDGKVNDLNSLQGISFDFSIQGNDVAYVEKLTKKPLPVKGAFAVSGKAVDIAAKKYKVDGLKVVMGDTTIDGTVDLDFTDPLPRIAAAMSSKQIVLKRKLISPGSGKAPKNDRLDLGPLNLSVQLEGLTETIALKAFDLKFGTEKLAAVMVSGSIRNVKTPQGVKLKFNVQGRNLGNIKQLTGRSLPVQGPFAVSGRIVDTSINQFTIRPLKIAVAGNQMNGGVALNLNGPKPQLNVTLDAQKFSPHRILAPQVLAVSGKQEPPDLGPLNLKMTLAGPARDLSLEAIDFNMGNEERIEAKLTGAVTQLAKFKGVRIDLSVRGKQARTLERFIGRPLPVQGAFFISGKITDTAEKNYRVENFKFALSENELQGWVDINPTDGQLRLTADLSAPQFNLRPLSNIKIKNIEQLKRIPNLGPLKITTSVVRRENKLSIEALDFHAGTEQWVQLQAKGAIKDLTAPSGITLDFSIRGNEVGKLADLTGQNLPIQGAFGVSGQITDTEKQNYQLGDLRIKLGDNNLSGRLDADFTGQTPRLAAELASQAFNLKPLTIKSLAPFTELSNLGPLKLAIKITGLKDDIRVENLDLALGSEELAAITLTGSINKVVALQGFNVDFSIKGKDLTNIQKMGGPALPYGGAFHLSGQVVDPAPKTYQLSKLDIIWGELDTKGAASLDLTSKRPQITAALTSQKADLRPIFGTVKSIKDQKKTPAEKKTKVFSSEPFPLDALMKLDADIKIRGQQVLLPRVALDDLTVELLLKDGGLTVKPVKFNVGGGSADARFALNYLKEAPMIEFAAKMDQLEIGPMLDKLGYKRKLEGMLSAHITLSGKGRSVAEIMAGLNGKSFLMVSDGQVAGNYLNRLENILGVQVLRLLNPFQTKVAYTKVNCYTNFVRINDGKAAINSLIDTDQTSIITSGKLDLKTEKLNIGLKPHPKKGFGHNKVAKVSVNFGELSKTMKLGGTLANPSLGVDTKQTAILAGKFAGGFLFGPFGLAAVAVSEFTDFSMGGKNPCLAALEEAKEYAKAVEGTEKAKAPEAGSKDQKEKEPAAPKREGVVKKLGRTIKGLFKP